MHVLQRWVLLAAMMTSAPAAHAAAVWCGLEDYNLRLGFVSDIRHETAMNPQQLRQLSSRFRRTVNERFGTAFAGDGGVCRSFPNQPKAESHLATQQSNWQARGYRITDVGVF
jgi:hypothetical protein